MNTLSLTFHDLPFVPEEMQVIYVESHYDEHINKLIQEHYHQIRALFKKRGFDFIYLPLFFKDEELKEKVLYYAPYLSANIIENTALQSYYLLRFIKNEEDIEHKCPSLLFLPQKQNDDWQFLALKMDVFHACKGYDVMQFFSDSLVDIRREYNYRYRDDGTRLRTVRDDDFNEPPARGPIEKIRRKINKYIDSVKYEGIDEPGLLSIRDEHVGKIIRDFQANANQLRLKGISLAVLHELIDKSETISRLSITDDLRLFLPDYNKIEIHLTPLYKAVYFLFLNHPEGIVLQQLESYHTELLNYYRQTCGNKEVNKKMISRIKEMEVYGSNGLNIVLSKIKAAFVNKIDEHLAKHYYIIGTKGDTYKIPLDRQLVVWENETPDKDELGTTVHRPFPNAINRQTCVGSERAQTSSEPSEGSMRSCPSSHTACLFIL